MGILRLATLGAIGYAGYKYFTEKSDRSAAFDDDQDYGGRSTPPVRDAGPTSMRDKPDTWSKTDESLDGTFPASDPATTY